MTNYDALKHKGMFTREAEEEYAPNRPCPTTHFQRPF